MTRILDWALKNRLAVILFFAVGSTAGLYAVSITPVDAVPDNTRYIPNSADSYIFLGIGSVASSDTITTQFDSDVPGATWLFNDSGPLMGGRSDTIDVRGIQWTLIKVIGENNGDANSGSPNFNDGAYDNGRVEFRVTIK